LFKIVSEYRNKLYKEFNLDSIFQRNDSLFYLFHIGEKYRVEQVKLILPDGKVKICQSNKNYNNWLDRIKNSYVRKAYPFVNIIPLKTDLSNSSVNAVWKLDENLKVNVNKVIVKPYLKLSKNYIQSNYGFKKGKGFRLNRFKRLDEDLTHLEVVDLIKNSELEYTDEGANLYLYLKKKRRNRFDGLLGFNQEKGKNSLTGYLDLILSNNFNRAEDIRFKWKKTDSESQNLKISYLHPYLFIKRIGLDLGLEILKQDSSYISTKSEISFILWSRRQNSLSVGYLSNSISNLNIDNINQETDRQMLGESKQRMGIVKFRLAIPLVYNINKFEFKLRSSYGEYYLKDLEDEDEQYKRNIAKISFESTSNFVINKLFRYQIGLLGAVISSDQIYQNSLYRIGGLYSVRGFRENQFYAKSYLGFRNDLILGLSKQYNVFAFTDFAVYENKSLNTDYSDKLLGLGVGLNLNLKSGVLKMVYAVGKTESETLVFRNAKLHFGFQTYF
jgi:hypothetical protein